MCLGHPARPGGVAGVGLPVGPVALRDGHPALHDAGHHGATEPHHRDDTEDHPRHHLPSSHHLHHPPVAHHRLLAEYGGDRYHHDGSGDDDHDHGGAAGRRGILAPPSTLPLTTKEQSGHVNPVFAELSGVGFFIALVLMAVQAVLTRRGGRGRSL